MDGMRKPRGLGRQRRKVLLDALRAGWTLNRACREAKVDRKSLWRWQQLDPKLDEEIRNAWAEGGDLLEDEAVRRGVHGWNEPVFYKGKQSGSVKKYSDVLLVELLRARRPYKFGDKTQVVVEEHHHHYQAPSRVIVDGGQLMTVENGELRALPSEASKPEPEET